MPITPTPHSYPLLFPPSTPNAHARGFTLSSLFPKVSIYIWFSRDVSSSRARCPVAATHIVWSRALRIVHIWPRTVCMQPRTVRIILSETDDKEYWIVLLLPPVVGGAVRKDMLLMKRSRIEFVKVYTYTKTAHHAIFRTYPIETCIQSSLLAPKALITFCSKPSCITTTGVAAYYALLRRRRDKLFIATQNKRALARNGDRTTVD